MTVAAETVLLQVQNAVATITLNRPEKLNAIEPRMLQRLEEIAGEIERDPGLRVVLLTGAGEQAFSVGADISAWSALEPLDMWRTWVRTGHRVLDRLARLRQPVIAVLNGLAFGGGLELALAADLRLADDQVEFGMPEVSLGTLPGWGGTSRLPSLVGPGRAKQLILTGARIDALTAERWGLVNEVVPRVDLYARAAQLAQDIAKHAPVAIQLAKQLIDSSHDGGTLESLGGALAATTRDAHEGLTAFRERRAPLFGGR